ncbi:hypothetical protein NLJ89_g8811 [Agrocybe chaxingu]|uniref:Xylanolytic transcriptional activator regulatory domain-containing protein n=1 Tax=Agrocybe chaxingu TaxID=84603 RepID=A0A9W8MU52_9AGAR|nr:hypothetical protein NLJ89_g8811 [Agrocybe chaxingu]
MPAEPTTKLKRRASRKELEEYRLDGSHGRELEMKRNRGPFSAHVLTHVSLTFPFTFHVPLVLNRRAVPNVAGMRSSHAFPSDLELISDKTQDKMRQADSLPVLPAERVCDIVPERLATGQGTRFVLAATEHLHRRIARLSGRIRQLEDALAVIHAKHSTEPHPLLHEDLIAAEEHDGTEDTREEGPGSVPQHKEVLDAFGTLSISEHGISRFFGPTGGSESLLLTNLDSNHASPASAHTPDSMRGSNSPSLNNDLSLFSQSFPFTPMGQSTDVQEVIEGHLPPYERTIALCETYFDQCGWLYKGTTRTQIMDDMVPVIYRQQAALPGEDYGGPHDLALLFIVLAIGALVGNSQEPSNAAQGEHFHQISRAALALQPVLEKPSIVTIQCLHLMSIYSAMSGGDMKSETSMEMAWSLITLSCHLSQTIGLHRDSARWGLSPKMVQRRRTLFWGLFVADVWQSMNNGRPPSFSLAYADCSSLNTRTIKTAPSVRRVFENWQFRFASECVADVTARTLTAEAPSYATIMDLDRKVREFPLPEGLGSSDDFGTSFQRFVLEHIKETVLMYIHRSFFAQAIMDHPANPLKSTYAPSFLAAYRASSTILKVVREQVKMWPNSCSRFWSMWTFAFSAAVVFGTVATRGPRSPLAQSAMAELEQACVLFSKAAATSLRAATALPILIRLSEKARYALAAAQKDPSPLSGDKGGLLWNIKQEDTEDELSILAGRTRFISTKKGDSSNSTPPHTTRFEPSPPLYPVAAPPAPEPMQIQISIPPPIIGSGYQVPSQPPPPPSSSSSMSSMSSSWEPQSRDEYMAPPMESNYSYSSSQRTTQPPPNITAPYNWSTESRQHSAGSSMQHRPVASSSQQQHHPNLPPPSQQYHMQSAPIERQGYYNSQYQPQSHSRAHPHSHMPPQHYAPQPLASSSSQHPSQHPSYSMYNPNPGYSATGVGPAGSNVDLADLGLVSRDSRLDERWGSFMADSGLLEDYRRR